MKLRENYSERGALTKMKLTSVPSSGEENYNYLKQIWTSKGMRTMRDFLEWYNNKDVVPTLEALQNMMAQFHAMGVDFLKAGFTLPVISNILLYKSTSAKF